MSSSLDLQLILAVLICAVALVVFVWHLLSTTRRAGLLMSESRVPRRFMLLGFLGGVGLIYLVRR